MPEGFHLHNFIEETKSTGLSRPNRFVVSLPFPKVIDKDENYTYVPYSEITKVLLLCESVQLPSYSYLSQSIRTYGETREAPYDRAYHNIPMSFYVDAKMRVKYFFDEWAGKIQNPVTRNFRFYDDYTVDMVIDVYNLKDNITYKVKCSEVYPKEMHYIQMHQGLKSHMMILLMNMQIRSWRTTAQESITENTLIPVAETTELYRIIRERKNEQNIQRELNRGIEPAIPEETDNVSYYLRRKDLTDRIPTGRI